MRSSFVALIGSMAISACGVAVRPVDSALSEDASIDAMSVFDVVGIDVAADEHAADRPDTQAIARDTGLPPRDAPNDVVDTGVPRGNECDERDSTITCQRFYRIGEGDLRSGFSCCNGYCESGSCARRSPEGIALCATTPCDIRAGQICCPGVAGRSSCFPRDRNLCP